MRDHCDKHRLDEEYPEARDHSGKNKTALRHQRQKGEVQRKQKGDGFECSKPRHRALLRKELNGGMREQKHDLRRKDSSRVETPGKPESNGKGRIVVKVD